MALQLRELSDIALVWSLSVWKEVKEERPVCLAPASAPFLLHRPRPRPLAAALLARGEGDEGGGLALGVRRWSGLLQARRSDPELSPLSAQVPGPSYLLRMTSLRRIFV